MIGSCKLPKPGDFKERKLLEKIQMIESAFQKSEMMSVKIL
jgi:hypothetical protein